MNRLQYESSPYLRQHAHNPVDWYPWGPAAFAKAEEEQKPVLVSIGYAACHWCHVMERESFEDPEVAAYMNEHFVCIKVDREERTDVDHLYMDALQVLTGQGGWPLNMFTTPDRKPFFGGTYFPPQRIYNRASWREVLEAVRVSWAQKKEEVIHQSEQLLQHLNQVNLQEKGSGTLPHKKEDFEGIIRQLLSQADEAYGGFGMAPKFPQTMSLSYLLQYHYSTGDTDALQHALFSIDKMIGGGIYDQIGGGLARYSTDAAWLAPHFEKMLYDNALFLELLAEAYQLSGNMVYAEVIEQTISFCIRELSIDGKGIGFYAALDADSEGEEGKFYVWDAAEIRALLPDMSPDLQAFWDISNEGNWEGKIILNHNNTAPETRQALLENEAFRSELEAAAKTLLEARSLRERPLTDTKILLSWNALMVAALAKCAKALKSETYFELAKNNLDYLLATFKADGEWFRNFDGQKLSIKASLEDLSFLIRALLITGEYLAAYEYIALAKQLQEFVDDHFSDEQNVFYYFSNKTEQDIVLRKVETYDGALPSVNAVMAENNLLLSKWFEDEVLAQRSMQMLQSMYAKAKHYPGSHGYWNKVLMQYLLQKTLVITNAADKEYDELVKYHYWPQVLIALKRPNPLQTLPLISKKPDRPIGEFYYCTQYVCHAPEAEAEKVFSKIKIGKMLE